MHRYILGPHYERHYAEDTLITLVTNVPSEEKTEVSSPRTPVYHTMVPTGHTGRLASECLLLALTLSFPQKQGMEVLAGS